MQSISTFRSLFEKFLKFTCLYKHAKSADPMNKEELAERLKKENVPSDWYSLNGGLPSEAYCLDYNNNQWETYYSERGKKDPLKSFDNEAEACTFLYHTITDMLKAMKIKTTP